MHTEEFGKLLSKIVKDYQNHLEEELAPTLTTSQLSVLEVLEQNGQLKPSDLIPFLATTPAAVTMLLDRMEKAELIRRDRDEEDRRIVWISITEKARRRPTGESRSVTPIWTVCSAAFLRIISSCLFI